MAYTSLLQQPMTVRSIAQISMLCAEQGISVSVADCAAESTFFFPAVCEGGGLIAGLVSDGSDHHAVSGMAKRIRLLLEENE